MDSKKASLKEDVINNSSKVKEIKKGESLSTEGKANSVKGAKKSTLKAEVDKKSLKKAGSVPKEAKKAAGKAKEEKVSKVVSKPKTTDDKSKKATKAKSMVDKKKSTGKKDVKSEKVSNSKKAGSDVKEAKTEVTKSEALKENKVEKKGKSTSQRKRTATTASSIVVDVVDNDLDNTGAFKTLNSSSFFSDIFNNKLITIEKEDKTIDDESNCKTKKGDISVEIDGKFRVDILDILIVIVITAIISCVVTGFILNYQFRKASGIIDNSVIGEKNVQNFLSIYSEIISNYYEEVNPEELTEAALKGMMSYLEDTYSIYLDDEESNGLTDMLDSSYEGIGIVIQGNVIRNVYKNSSADQAGVKVNDVIVKVNGTEITEENYVDIGEFLRKDEDNTLVVKRNEEELTFVVSFSKVSVPTTSSTTMEYNGKRIGYVQLTSFSTLSFEEFEESLMDIEEKGMDSLIIDLRNNSGGYLKAAYDIASLFIEKGKVIYSLEQKDKVTDYVDETKDKKNYSIVVLVNSSTASASEVLASALHDSYGAILVGKTTYGKGTVQTIKQLDDDSIVKYTSAKWLRPNGECINGIGITPDYEVEVEYSNSQIYDKQLDKAIELLSK